MITCHIDVTGDPENTVLLYKLENLEEYMTEFMFLITLLFFLFFVFIIAESYAHCQAQRSKLQG